MDEISNLLMKKTKDLLADIIDILFSDKDFVITTTTPKVAIVNFIENQYVNGPVLPNLFSALSSKNFDELTALMCISPDEFILEPGYKTCEIFYKLGLVRKKYNYYYPTSVLAKNWRYSIPIGTPILIKR